MTWVLINDAPLNTLGHVWCERQGDRTDCLGSVYEYDDGGRGVSSQWHGFEFTHWHPLPSAPSLSSDTASPSEVHVGGPGKPNPDESAA